MRLKNKQLSSIEDYGTVIYKGYSGSRSYGTNITEEAARKLAGVNGGDWKDYVSDVDIRGIFIPHSKFLYGTKKVDEFRDPNEEDTVYFSLEKFLHLAIEGNPNVLEQLFIRDEDIIYMNDIGKELRENRQWFISKNVFGRFGSYAWSQLKRMTVQNDEFKRNKKRQLIIDMTDESSRYDSKNAMHLIRLFQMGIEILTKGTLSTFRENFKELLSFRNGDYSLEYIKKFAEELNLELEKAMKYSTISNVPDFEKINKWAIQAINRTHGVKDFNGSISKSPFQILPVEYEMVDKTTIFLTSNPLVRRLSNSSAHGMLIPYTDWFIGLRKFSEFKFDNTTIEFIHKFVQQVQNCNPRHMDTIFAPNNAFIFKHELADEFLDKMRTIPTSKRAYYTAKGYIDGNLKMMENWELKKEKHEELKSNFIAAKKVTAADWDKKFLESAQGLNSIESSLSLKKDYENWKDLSQTKGNLPFYPSVPDKTKNENASHMGKFGYDTLLASQLYHVASMYIELLGKGYIENSRAYESNMYAIKHGKYKTFDEFKKTIVESLKQMETANLNSVLPSKPNNDVETWLIDFIHRYHETL